MIPIVLSRLLPYPSFWKFLALQVAAIVFIVFVASSLTGMTVQGNAMPLAELFKFPDAWATVTAMSRWLFFLPAFFTVQLVTAELELKLVRAQIISGLERRDVVLVWAMQSVLLAAAAMAATVLAVLLVAKPGGEGFRAWPMVSHELGFGLFGVIFLTCAALSAVLMRRPVPALVLLLLWPLVIEPTIGSALERYGLAPLRQYLPFATFSTLAPWPGLGGTLTWASPTTGAAVAYGVLAAVLTWTRLSRTDL